MDYLRAMAKGFMGGRGRGEPMDEEGDDGDYGYQPPASGAGAAMAAAAGGGTAAASSSAGALADGAPVAGEDGAAATGGGAEGGEERETAERFHPYICSTPTGQEMMRE